MVQVVGPLQERRVFRKFLHLLKDIDEYFEGTQSHGLTEDRLVQVDGVQHVGK